MKNLKFIFLTLLLSNFLFSSLVLADNPDQQDPDQKETKIDNIEREPVRILVTGSLSPQGMERVGKPIKIMNQDEIKKERGATIGETLATQPGVSSTSFAPGAGRPIIRGQNKDRVRVLENGLEIGDVSSVSDDHSVTTDPLTATRIDILRGPSTLMFGSQAIGGVVNIIDDSIAEENIGKDLTGKLDLRKGNQADDENSGAIELKGQAGSLNWYASGFYRETEDLNIPGYGESDKLHNSHSLEEDHDDHNEGDHNDHDEDYDIEEDRVKGRLDNSDTRSHGVKVGLSHVWDDGFFGVAVRKNGSKYGVPGAHSHFDFDEDHDDHDDHDNHDDHLHDRSSEHSDGHDDVRIDIDQTRYEARGGLWLKGDFFDSLKYGLAYSDYSHKELEGKNIGTEYKRDSFEGRMLLTHKHDEVLEGGIGLQINYDDLEAIGDEAFVPSTSTFSPAIFFIEDYSLSKNYILQLGGRYEYANLDPEGELEQRSFNIFSASTGLLRVSENKEYSTALNFTYSERAPNASELYSDGAHLATQTFEIGDIDLEKEKSFGTELVISKVKGDMRGSLTGFWQHYFDYIGLNPNGKITEGFNTFNYEETEARFWGFEAEAELDLLDYKSNLLTFYSGFDYLRGRDLDNSSNLPRMTPTRGKTGLKYSYNNFSSYVEGFFVGSQDKVADFELETDSYTLLNAGLNYKVNIDMDRSVDFYVRGTNLTDEEARVHNSFLKDQVPLRGRAVFFGLTTYF